MDAKTLAVLQERYANARNAIILAYQYAEKMDYDEATIEERVEKYVRAARSIAQHIQADLDATIKILEEKEEKATSGSQSNPS